MNADVLKKLLEWIVAVTSSQSISAKRTVTTENGQYRITVERIEHD